MVGHPGYAPGVSPSQAARIGYLPRARGCDLKLVPWRFRRDLHPLMSRSTTVRLVCFGFGTLARQRVGVGGNAPQVSFRHVF